MMESGGREAPAMASAFDNTGYMSMLSAEH